MECVCVCVCVECVCVCVSGCEGRVCKKNAHMSRTLASYGIWTPLVLVQSSETSVMAKSTSKAAICSLRMSRCLMKNS